MKRDVTFTRKNKAKERKYQTSFEHSNVRTYKQVK